MGLTDVDIGQNIQRARYRRGLTQAELAISAGLDRTAVSRVEAGTRSLAATELALVAAILDVPVHELLQPAPEPLRSPNLARMLMRAGPVGANDEPQLTWFIDLIERAAAVTPGASPLPLNRRLFTLPARAAGELAARRARRRLGLDSLAPIAGLSGLLCDHGVLVATARFPSASRLAGCALALPSGPSAILVNANHPAARQRFTVCHELAHLLFDTESPVSACNVGEIRPGPRSRAELRADAFAAAFLLPKRALASLAAPSLDLQRLHAVESDYGVSHAAAVHRLQDLGMLADDEARLLRKVGVRPQPPRGVPPFRLVGESLAQLLADVGARRSGDERGYEVVPDGDVVA